MKFKKIAFSFLFALAIAASIHHVWRSYKEYRILFPAERPNILIVSVCSMRRDLLEVYGGGGVMSSLDKFFADSSFYFTNAFNPLGWTSLVSFIDPNGSGEIFRASDYHTFGTYGGLFLRVPPRRNELLSNNVFEKDYKQELTAVQSWIRFPRPKPFAVQVHVKYLHYPLIDRYDKDAEWDFYLNDEEKKFVADIQANPGRYWRKLPLVLMLTNDHRVFASHPEIRKRKIPARDFTALEGLMTNPEMLKAWKAEPDYARDLEVLKKIYRANARQLDKIIAPLLNLWGDEELRKKTIVMFMSDHGETHMERDLLTHGASVYDDALVIAGAVSFPGDTRAIKVEEQYDYRVLGQWVKNMVQDPQTADQGLSGLRKLARTPFLTRDCNFDRRGLRADNAYKYFVNTSNDERFLFDLKNDPGELRNIAAEAPELVQKFEAQFWELYPLYSAVPVNNCTPWPTGN